MTIKYPIASGLWQELKARVWSAFEGLMRWVSAEHLLDHVANGGAVILARSAWVTVLVLGLAVLWEQALDPCRCGVFSLHELRLALVKNTSWIGVVFAAVYAALYARFSSQWTYLAGLYNQIKQTEASIRPDSRWSNQVISEWKAGFITDAIAVHLSRKYPFKGVIIAWAGDQAVEDAFVCGIPAEQEKWDQLLSDLGAQQKTGSINTGDERA